jgi:cell division protein FtsI/penicillin-binding protein 2
LKNRQFVIIIIAASFTILALLLFLLFTHQQKLRKASENRELSTKLEHEKKVQQYEKRQRKLEKEKQKAEIDAKTREITSYSMLVANKNKMLAQIKELTAQIFDNKENAQKIENIIQHNLNMDEEWENFKMHFEKVHPHFFEKLHQHCEHLTQENLKMCAYIKMRMTSKQIAQLLHVVPASIITSRFRLKKKLKLAEEKDLDGFIGGI